MDGRTFLLGLLGQLSGDDLKTIHSAVGSFITAACRVQHWLPSNVCSVISIQWI